MLYLKNIELLSDINTSIRCDDIIFKNKILLKLY